ncbi:BamA/TamA family outer membrane protein [Cylindrospermopsis raciborskii]|uniref:Surface antigen (D15) n=2 Tax=Cylindrospermopsis raciborskii TaxID=77022 RepID=A0A853MF09_9CYAN|nr:BamA/TamA family outer membrane protein [Cylindrospermopsis raciborskii]EFA71182.1 Surface antigen variable number [Cylindrospermopsis raciborskii CS-505]MBA4444277.1 BamA/TamA family outer membrane protein [Cylindrospermopsis raciborskii CS-506_C]MBA4448498.1 BamA/TamA family outer membrane protein [Cylindrospermopsis raciborskii CS-506_D]MBA4455124.1 BamA/TamA family outer membrane protein [Cylindrospermopsis raciborskii CS-506_B]MBA4464468.1 BamA/TamA family outer membrane protein [Cylin
MSKKHLSPVFLVTVAIAASLESSLSASGQTPSQSQQLLDGVNTKASQLLSSNLYSVKGETFIGQTAPVDPNSNGNAVDNNQPDNQPNGQPTNPNNTEQPTETAEPRVLISEVVVKSAVGQLPSEIETQVYQVIRTKAGQPTTRSQLQEDINGIFAIGFFTNVQAVPEDTPSGVRITFVVSLNPVLSKVELDANPGAGVASVIPADTVDKIFSQQYGKVINLRDLRAGIAQLTKEYQDKGYVLANLIAAPKVSETGVITLQVAEGIVENVQVAFRNKEGQDVDEKGRPIRGRTKDYIIKREMQLKPGQVFNRNIVQKDLQRVFGLGLFDDINVSLNPGTDPSKVVVVVNVTERNSGSIAVGGGISSASGLFGTISYQEQNLSGRNQKLGSELQIGQRELLFDLRFSDTWIDGDPYRTSYTTNVFRRRSISLVFEGKDSNIKTFNLDNTTDVNSQATPRIARLGGGVSFGRPLSTNLYENPEWFASLGLQYQRISSRDGNGNIRPQGAIFDDSGNRLSPTIPLTQSPTGEDDLFLLQLSAQSDRRNNAVQPTKGSYLRVGLDQSVPIGQGSILMSRVKANYSQYVPIKLLGSKNPETLAFNLQGGTILGDLPPYEAFSLGGSNSVRGYDEGKLAAGRTYVQASAEYRFPIFSVVGGSLFFDCGTDLGSATRAAEILNKNGSGYGYGLGLRIQSPLGPIRIDYGISDRGDSRINFGIGERF